jgi:hypothetical protein
MATESSPASPAPSLRAPASLLNVLASGQGLALAHKLRDAAQGAAQSGMASLQAAAADAQALALSGAAALSALGGAAAGAAGGGGGAAPLAGAEEAALRARELRASSEAASARWLAREVDYATASADSYKRTLREVALNKQALRPCVSARARTCARARARRHASGRARGRARAPRGTNRKMHTHSHPSPPLVAACTRASAASQ